MVVRLTRFQIPPGKAEEAKKIYQKEVVPVVKKQKGIINVMLLEPTDGSKDYISFTSWAKKADADAYESSGKYKQLVEKIKAIISGETVLNTYSA